MEQIERQIHLLCHQIAEKFHPEQIILFGSHAYGHPTPESDIDLLVVMPFEGRHTQQAIQILNYLNILLPMDVIVRTPQQVQERLAIGDPFMQEIVQRGQIMYETNHA
ncbi:MAG: nucleotidyltransferase domain-containing protein [Acidobacteria bacterium]|nr:nucleotidyltransferase domain-containing protein [Acidobacteriota bacterium]